MKRILIIIVSIAFSISAYSQRDRSKLEEHYRSQKIAFITERMELAPEEAEVFWPYYHEMEAQKKKLMDDKVILGLSGGVDSSVAAVLLDKAIGKNLHCVFVNNGLLRKNEYDEVLRQYVGMGLNVKGVDSSDLFLNELIIEIALYEYGNRCNY